MQTTVDLDDRLLEELKRRAQQEGVTFDEFCDRVLRTGLESAESGHKTRFRQTTHDLGEILMPLDQAQSIAADLENEEIVRKLSLGK